VAALAVVAAIAGGGAGAAKEAAQPRPAGTVATSFGAGRLDGAFAVVVQPDGRIVVAGASARGRAYDAPRDLALARYLPDGRLDPSFGAGGRVLTPMPARWFGSGLALQPDGKLLAGGSPLVRYLADGRLDASFGQGGKASTGIGPAFLLQRDGKIVVAGSTPNRYGQSRFAVRRYLPDGRVDASFGRDGAARTANFGTVSTHTDASDYVSDVAIQGDGRIVAAGAAEACGACNLTKFALARYLPNGRLDTRFGRSGAVVDFDREVSYAEASAVALQEDGRIVAAGWWGDGAGLAFARYRPDGSLDRSFGARGHVPGRARDGVPEQALDVAIQGDGRIVAAGVRTALRPRQQDFLLVRLGPHGGLDRSFGRRGRAVTSFSPGGTDIARALAIQGDGKIVAVGSTAVNRFAVARYLPDGRLDASFGRSG
jgi:uncharacterized delta-60 repeat protein